MLRCASLARKAKQGKIDPAGPLVELFMNDIKKIGKETIVSEPDKFCLDIRRVV